jgi:acyl-[acyl-carrier-protein]-phospholipid O-acyltransferase/long-chain-fatty-acid--[acyl-carrier-protein] ligase
MPDAATADSADLNQLTVLPAQNRRSLGLVLAVQALNAFNDNFVKMLLIAFAGAVAAGTELGDSMQVYLGAIFCVPYVFFAPVAGWLSDRYSKRTVMVWMQVAQVIVFGAFIAAMMLHEAQMTLALSLVAFFLLATQATFFSPAKMGIIKELVGGKRLGPANGMLQMTMFIGILSGMWAGGAWFGARLHELNDPWASAWIPMLVVSALALLQIPGALAVMRTPEHSTTNFHRGVWTEHFTHLKLVFGNRPIKLAAIGVSYFWFMSNAVGTILVTLSRERHPGDSAAAATTLSTMAAMLGIGIIVGSALAALASKRRTEMGLVPIAGIGLGVATLLAGLAPQTGPLVYFGMVGIGLAGGAFMTPLYAFVQQRSHPDELARVLSAMNLMDCLASIVANIVVVKLMLMAHIPARWQLVALAPLAFVAAVYMSRLLTHDLVRFILLTIVRLAYKVRPVNAQNVPETGGVLMLSNHVSYVDAFVLGAACGRKVRFVMWDELYNIKFVTWFLKAVGTVPISATRAKDAIRNVAAALKEGQVVCLFPEGQITRHGMFNDLRKGFELMARQGGAHVQPVYLEGLYGSVVSHEGGKCFKRWPKLVRYPVRVHFGKAMPARDGTTEAVHGQWLDMSANAFAARTESRRLPNLPTQATANALRLMEAEWAQPGETLLCLAPTGSALHQTLQAYTQFKPLITLTTDLTVLSTATEPTVIVIGSAQDLAQLKERAPAVRLVMCWDDVSAAAPPDALRGVFESSTGELLTISVPDPEMPKGEEGNQLGHAEGNLGRALPGAFTSARMQAFLAQWQLELTELGFLKPKPETPAI